jgi:YaiO family outer membrane protein
MKGYLLCLFSMLFVCGISAQNRDSIADKQAAYADKLAQKNNFAEADRIMTKLVAEHPKNTDYKVYYGALCSWEHKFDSSKTILHQVLAVDPKNLDAYDALTNAELWSKDDSMAIIDCNKAILLANGKKEKDATKIRETYMLKIAEANLVLNKFPRADTAVDFVLTRKPTDSAAKSLKLIIDTAARQKSADSLFDTATHMTNRRVYPPAEKITKKLTAAYPKEYEYKILWSRDLAYMHKIDTSITLLNQIIAADPNNLEAYDALADDELLATKFKLCDSIATKGIKLPVKGDRTELIITKASAEDNMGEYYEGVTTLDTLSKRDTGNSEIKDLEKILHAHILLKKADSLFTIAQTSASKKNYKAADSIVDTIIRWFPDNMEYVVFKGRVFGWQGQYDSSIAVERGVIKKDPHNVEAYDALTDAELWKTAFPACVTDCDKILQDSIFIKYPSMFTAKKDSMARVRDSLARITAGKDTIKKDPPNSMALSKDTAVADSIRLMQAARDSSAKHFYPIFMLKRAHALYYEDFYQQTVNTLDTMRKVDSTNPEANDLLTEAKIKLLKNSIQFGYLNNCFNAGPPYGPFDFAWIAYTRNFFHCPVMAKITYGSVYGLPIGWQEGVQFELGAFPKFTNSTFGDADVAYSNSFAVFPQWTASANLYEKLPLGFEVSVGGMYMHFIDVVDEPPTPPQDVWIFDPYIGFYLGGKWQFSYRPYFAYKAPDIYITHTLTLRHFFKNEDTYVSLMGVIGSSPFVDYYYPAPQPTYMELVGVDCQTRLPHNWMIGGMVSYEYEEYYEPLGLWQNMYIFQVTLTKRF